MAEQRAKLVMCGESGVGKTSLIQQYLHGSFGYDDNFHACSWKVSFTQTKNISIAGKTVKAEMWDTAGQEKYAALTRMYFKAADGGVLVYDVSERRSFEQVLNWRQQIQENAVQASYVLVGNKCDLSADRAVSYEEGCGFANTLGVPFVETSAKTGLGVVQAFQAVVAGIVHSRSLR